MGSGLVLASLVAGFGEGRLRQKGVRELLRKYTGDCWIVSDLRTMEGCNKEVLHLIG